MRNAIIENYAPRIEPDEFGGHFVWAFNFVRDQALHFPWFMRDPEHRLSVPVPPAAVLHRSALDVLKALDTYADPYIAAFEYRAYERMPNVEAPVLLLKADSKFLGAYIRRLTNVYKPRFPPLAPCAVGDRIKFYRPPQGLKQKQNHDE